MHHEDQQHFNLTSLSSQLGRGPAHVTWKSDLLIEQAGSFLVIAQVVNKNRRAQRYSALFCRHDPPGAYIPNEDVALVWLPLDVDIDRIKGLARHSDVAHL